MSKKTLFWIFLVIGIVWITGVSYWYISVVENLDLRSIKWEENIHSKDPATQTFFQGVLLVIIFLLVTALIFYLIGLFFGRKKEDTFQEIEKENKSLKDKLAEQLDKLENMKILYTGGKIDRKKREQTKKVTLSSTIFKETENQIPKISPKNKEDLKIISGIGERIEFFLNESGIYTWEQLSNETEESLRNILLLYGGEAYKIHNPSQWPKQAALAHEKKWDELNELKDKIRKG